MAKIITVMNQKGGVGKTTIAFNLIRDLAARGMRVLAVDNDPQGNLTSTILIDHKKMQADVSWLYLSHARKLTPQKITDNLDLIGANIKLANIQTSVMESVYNFKAKLTEMSGEYDFVIIDCLPSLGTFTLASLGVATHILIPTQASPYAKEGLQDLMSTIATAKNTINQNLQIVGIVINQVDGRKTILGKSMMSSLRKTYKDLIMKSVINKSVIVEEGPLEKRSVHERNPLSNQGKQFHKLTEEILEKVW